ncbi:MAG: ABC transporter ATP-binding protein [Firmicutes bacterium]|nr:ABC transporter ATP-binding protein [Bacillota bacterium]
MAERNDKMVNTDKDTNKTGELVISDIVKKFRQSDGEEITALNGVNLNIPAGSFVSFIGPSGCGKTTLLRIIAGLEKPTSCTELTLDGEPIKKAGYDRGFVFQSATLFSWLNIYDNVAFSLRARKIYKENKDLVDEYINLVGLSGFEHSYPHQLSGGMQQRASIARALVGHPKVLLLDEPLGALDAFTRMNMQDEILRIWKEKNMTMIMVTHDVDEAVYLSDKVVVMSPRPAKIEKIIDIDLYRKRARNSPDFLRLRSEILEILDYAGKSEEVDYYI